MNIKEVLLKYAGLFEEVWEKDYDLVERDNWDDYKEVIQKLRNMGAYKGRNTIIEQMEDIKNELPFDQSAL